MAKFPQLARPVVRRRAGLHADKARWQLLEKADHLPAPKLLGDDRLYAEGYWTAHFDIRVVRTEEDARKLSGAGARWL